MSQANPTKTQPLGTALVTGASSGIGAVYADRLAKRGHDLILVARDEARLNLAAGKLRTAYSVSVLILPADLSTESGIATVERRLESDPSITMLVNNAGIGVMSALTEMNPASITGLIQLNVLAAARLAGAAARAFAPRGVGTIINIASVLGLVAEFFNPVYNATKAFVLSLSQNMHRELSPQGVRVQAVLPGVTRTEIFERAGGNISVMPAEMIMEVDEMVDASLSGLDQGEVVTIPSLPDAGDFEAFTQARLALGPNLSRNHAADRYRVSVPV
jgi:short-subunit dehydrogenase